MKKISLFLSVLGISFGLNATTLIVTNSGDSGSGSLREAIETAADGDSIIFDTSLSEDTIGLLSTLEITAADITIDGENAPGLSIAGNGTFVLFASENEVNYRNLTFVKGYGAVNQKGGSFTNCTFDNNTGYAVNLQNSDFYNFKKCVVRNTYNSGEPAAAAVAVRLIRQTEEYTEFAVEDCMFENNTNKALSIYCYSGTSGLYLLKISGSSFANNAGGISIETGAQYYYGNVEITNSKFENNHVLSKGGGLDVYNVNNLKISECNFTGCSAGAYGGGLCISGFSYAEVSDCTLSGSKAAYGGGAFVQSSNFFDFKYSIERCSFIDNGAHIAGAGIAFIGTGYLNNSTFLNNSASTEGGAVFLGDANPAFNATRIRNNTFSENNAADGGAVSGYSLSIGNIFYNNSSSGGVYNDIKSVVSNGYNIYNSNQDSFFTDTTDYKYTGPETLLLPLGFYGGFTPTLPVDSTVSMLESIVRIIPSTENALTTDQRGLPRPGSGLLACAGAVEIQDSPRSSLNITENILPEPVIYPNPAADFIYLPEDMEYTSLEIFSIQGSKIRQLSEQTGNVINTSGLPSGTYILRIINGTTHTDMKLIKK